MRRSLVGASAVFAVSFVAACSDSAAPVTSPADAALSRGAAGTETTGDYIVLFKPGTPNPNDLTDELLRAFGGREKARYQHAVQGFAATLPLAALDGIRRNPNVEIVEADGIAYASGEQTLTSIPSQWGLDRLDVRARTYDLRYNYDNDGAGVHAYILDTGIKASHQEFSGRVVSFRNYTTSDPKNTDDVQGHGTHVAGTVGGSTVGVAKNVTLYAVKVLGDNGSGDFSWVIAAIDTITGIKKANPARPMVGNMSLGGGFYSPVNTAVNNSVAAGVIWAVAAGNSSADACNYSPAAAGSALTVGATESSDARASYSNFGSCVDVFAPGSAIYSSIPNGGYSGSYSGTSMASPHVAGAAALYLSAFPTATSSAVNSWIISNATTGLVTSAGTGSPNRLLYTRGIGPTYALTVSRTGTGTGTVASNPSGINCGTTCSTSFAENTSVTLTATPSATSSFASWSGCASTSGTSCTVSMSAARSVTATFDALPTNLLTVTKAGAGTGSVTSNPTGISCGSTCSTTNASFLQTASVTLTATPTTGHSFTGWSGDCSGTGTCTVAMSAARNVTATFAPPPPPADMHLNAIAGFSTLSSKNWSATVTVTMHDANHQPASGVTVALSFSGAASGTTSCITGSNGSCSATRSGLNNKRTSLTFTVTGATKSGYSYTSGSNDVSNSVTINR